VVVRFTVGKAGVFLFRGVLNEDVDYSAVVAAVPYGRAGRHAYRGVQEKAEPDDSPHYNAYSQDPNHIVNHHGLHPIGAVVCHTAVEEYGKQD
jgi:hypothetical protein